MAKRDSKNGPQYSTTLLKGEECLWLGFHSNASDYSTMPITNHFFQDKALKGHIGIVRQAGLYGAEIEFHTNEGGISKLNIDTEELLPMTDQESSTLKDSIANKEAITVSTQIKEETQKVSTNTTGDTYRCVENGCSFSSPSPQGLGTHRAKTHNLASRSQRRSGGGRKVILSSGTKVTKPTSTTTKKTVSSTPKKIVATGDTVTVTPNTRDSWKAKHDAVVKRYNRLFTKHNAILNTLKKLSNGI